MKFVEYNPVLGSGCIVRTFLRLLDKDVSEIKNELFNLAQDMGYDDYSEISVFEKYLDINNYEKIDNYKDILVKDLSLDYGKYALFCYDKNDYYHMFSIIDNIIYDKNDKCLDLYVISVYKLK